MSPATLTVQQAYDALAAKYTGQGWACFREFSLMHGRRRADLVAFNCYPSRGMEIHYVEVKAQRADVVRELADPAKADEVGQYADRIWLAVTDRNLVDKDELPPGWGLYWPRGKQLIVGKRAVKRPDPTPADRAFFARMILREESRVAEANRLAHLDKRVQQAIRDTTQEVEERIHAKYAELRESIEAFEVASGLKINDYNGEYLGAAVAEVRRGNRLRMRQRAKSAKATFERLCSDIDAFLEAGDEDRRTAT